nr:single-stranded-DNA-specific exonuclease RecJ [Paenibacillus turpanensis]
MVSALEAELGLPPLVAKLLAVRGFASVREAALFLEGDGFHDPYELKGMAEAVERIRRALTAGETIRIYGDYDADGVSSTALMFKLFRQLGARFDYYIPHRIHEGYGLNRKALEQAAKNNVTLIVTVDTGISAVEEIKYAKELGIDVVVTDHHEPPEVLPEAYAIVNPKQPGCMYPFKSLAGVGVALKLAQALLERFPEELTEFAALGTVADLMPLNGENRLIVKLGLEQMRRSQNPGLRALIGVVGTELRDVTEQTIGFALAPRINAGGRIDTADTAVKLLVTDQEQEAEHLAYDLDQLNKERQRIVDEMTKEALEMAEHFLVDGVVPPVLVLAKEGWNIGVMGIVASKLLEKYYRPVFVLSIDSETGMCKGSGRSIDGFDMYRALTECAQWMDHYGGHQAAAGLTMAREHIDAFRSHVVMLADQWLSEESYLPVMEADSVCSLSDVSLEHAAALSKLAPYGSGNPLPRFMFLGAELSERRTMGREQQHAKLMLVGEQGPIEAVGFGFGALLDWIAPGAKVDVIGELGISEWNGIRKPQIMIRDIRVQEVQAFDWRGVKKPEDRIRQLVSGIEAVRTEKPNIAVVWFGLDSSRAPSGRMVDEWEKLWGGQVAMWLCLPPGEDSNKVSLEPLNKAAERLGLSESTDLVLYNLPPSLRMLTGCLQSTTSAQRIYGLFQASSEDELSPAPSREHFKDVYSLLRSSTQPLPDRPAMLNALSRRTGISAAAVQFILEVLLELNVLDKTVEGYTCIPNAPKKDLSQSFKYRYKLEIQDVERQLVFSSSLELSRWLLQEKSGGLIKKAHLMEEIV